MTEQEAKHHLARLSVASQRLLGSFQENFLASIGQVIATREFAEWKTILEEAADVSAAHKPFDEEKDQRLVFALAPLEDGTGHALAIGLVPGSWEYIKDGTCSTIDLRKMGYPLTVMVFGGESREQIKKLLTEARPLKDVSHLDLGIKPPPKKRK